MNSTLSLVVFFLALMPVKSLADDLFPDGDEVMIAMDSDTLPNYDRQIAAMSHDSDSLTRKITARKELGQLPSLENDESGMSVTLVRTHKN